MWLCILYIIFGRYVLLLFMEKDSASALMTGQQFLWILSPFYFVVSAKLTADGILRGMGNFPMPRGNAAFAPGGKPENLFRMAAGEQL